MISVFANKIKATIQSFKSKLHRCGELALDKIHTLPWMCSDEERKKDTIVFTHYQWLVTLESQDYR